MGTSLFDFPEGTFVVTRRSGRRLVASGISLRDLSSLLLGLAPARARSLRRAPSNLLPLAPRRRVGSPLDLAAGCVPLCPFGRGMACRFSRTWRVPRHAFLFPAPSGRALLLRFREARCDFGRNYFIRRDAPSFFRKPILRRVGNPGPVPDASVEWLLASTGIFTSHGT